MSLRGRGLWDVPHPWLNMFVPKSGITQFKDLLMDTISPDNFEGLILVYPLLRDKWGTNTSVVLPEAPRADRVMYVVGSSAPQAQAWSTRLSVATAALRRPQGARRREAVPGPPAVPGEVARPLRPALGPVRRPQVAVRPELHPQPGQGIFPRVYTATSLPI
uniref:Cytokinin dehydrogenase 1 FAD/cytokinin binding domain-containing protein n=1 Tax=Ananas comosus var. bracteatus TaxID=296719 RepID=A0A6V7PZ51_ANACO|nr:unnamed protein product [Ananas comosus var. bracteatus]